MDAQFQALTTNLKEVTEAINVDNSKIKELSTIAHEYNVIFRKHVHNMHRSSLYQYASSSGSKQHKVVKTCGEKSRFTIL